MSLKEIYNYFLNTTGIKFDVVEIIKERGLNYVYKIRFDDQDYILKIYRKKTDFQNSNSLIEFLNANKVSTIKTTGEFELGEYTYKIYPFIDGEHIFKYNDNEINKITDLLALLYRNNLTNGETTILDKCDYYFSYLLSKNDKSVSDDVYRLLYNSYRRLKFDKDNFILVHGDLSNTNIIWNKNINIIDFDETILAPAEYEMCSCIIKNCFDYGNFDIEQAKKIFNSLRNKVNIDYNKFRSAWDLYIIKVIIEKLFYHEQSKSRQEDLSKGRDHWSYWYDLLLNENIISELFNYNKNKDLSASKSLQILKSDYKSHVEILLDSNENKYIEKTEYIFDAKQAIDEYNLVSMLYNNGLNDLIIYNMFISESQTVKHFSFCEGKTKSKLSSADIKLITQRLYSIYDFLLRYGSEHLQNETGSILDKLNWCLSVLRDSKYSSMITNLINDKEFIHSLSQERKVIVLDDLHRDNILFNKDGSLTFIDFNGLKKYPKSLQLASLITNLLLLYGDDRIKCVIDNWPEKFDLNQMNKLIKYRILKGLAYYEKYLSAYRNEVYDNKAKTLKKSLNNMI